MRIELDDIEVPDVPEPEQPDEGVFDPGDTYAEGAGQ